MNLSFKGHHQHVLDVIIKCGLVNPLYENNRATRSPSGRFAKGLCFSLPVDEPWVSKVYDATSNQWLLDHQYTLQESAYPQMALSTMTFFRTHHNNHPLLFNQVELFGLSAHGDSFDLLKALQRNTARVFVAANMDDQLRSDDAGSPYIIKPIGEEGRVHWVLNSEDPELEDEAISAAISRALSAQNVQDDIDREAMSILRRDDAQALKATFSNPNTCPNGGAWSLLHYAAWLGAKDCAKALIEMGADIHARTEAGVTPLDASLMRIWEQLDYDDPAQRHKPQEDIARALLRADPRLWGQRLVSGETIEGVLMGQSRYEFAASLCKEFGLDAPAFQALCKEINQCKQPKLAKELLILNERLGLDQSGFAVSNLIGPIMGSAHLHRLAPKLNRLILERMDAQAPGAQEMAQITVHKYAQAVGGSGLSGAQAAAALQSLQQQGIEIDPAVAMDTVPNPKFAARYHDAVVVCAAQLAAIINANTAKSAVNDLMKELVAKP